MIRADSLSYAYTLTATLVAVYLATFELGLTILFPVILLTTGVALQIYFTRTVTAGRSSSTRSSAWRPWRSRASS